MINHNRNKKIKNYTPGISNFSIFYLTKFVGTPKQTTADLVMTSLLAACCSLGIGAIAYPMIGYHRIP